MKLTPQEKLDIAMRCYSALSQAVALGAKIDVHPQSLRLWLDGQRTSLNIAQAAKSEIDATV